MNRRELLKLTTAGLVAITGAGAQAVNSLAKNANWAPAFFNKHQYDTVVAFAEQIMPRTDTPGATDAKVGRYIDLFLTLKSKDEQAQFVGDLGVLDQLANQQFHRAFVDCANEQQTVLVTTLSTAKPAQGARFFHQMKELTTSIYYNTPEGYRELNKFGPPPATVGCTHSA